MVTKKEVFEYVTKEIKINLVQLCKEIDEWVTTSILKDGKLRELAKVYVNEQVFTNEHSALYALRRVIELDAVAFVASMDQQD